MKSPYLKIFLALSLLLFSCIFLDISAQTSAPETCLSKHPSNDRYGSYSPDGRQVLFESDRNGNWDIFILDLQTNETKALVNSPKDERRPSWHPNGRQIIFESLIDENSSDLHTLDIASSQSQIVLDQSKLKGNLNFARFSPNGEQIAFTYVNNEGTFEIYLFQIKDNSLTKISDNPYRNVYPYWSPNGKELLCFSRKDTQNEDDEVYRINLKNNKWKRLTNWPKHNFCPAWSNNGKKIAHVISMENSRPEIYIMNKNGKKLKRITYNEDGDTLPSWSPNDDKLLITAYRNGNFEICELQIEQ